jgi:long-chain acyl-CoA synthetase
MAAEWLLSRMEQRGHAPAVVWRDAPYAYDWLVDRVRSDAADLEARGVPRGAVVGLVADYSPAAIALLLALWVRDAVVVPVVGAADEPGFATAEVQAVLQAGGDGEWTVSRRDGTPRNPLLRGLLDAGHPGLVLFSSGSTGARKAVLHDVAVLVEKFRTERRAWRTIPVLLFDHIGGVNTLLFTLANGGCLVVVERRDAETVCRAVERHRVELLPASPTFLQLVLLSEAHRRHDLSSLQRVTYGTEVMSDAILARLHEALPGVELTQTYGLSEVGILQTKSRGSGSAWMRVGGNGFEVKVVDGTLRVRARTAMLGYLDAPSPFDEDGWLDTQDVVEQDGEWLRILGRRTDLINVGGEKVSPRVVEEALLEAPGVRDATAYGEPSPVLGEVVAARVALADPEDPAAARRRLRRHARTRLAAHQVPVRIEIVSGPQVSSRLKRVRPS